MIRVLVVDDEEDWRTLISNALPYPDYRVDTAASYPEALELLNQGTPYDVAVVDLNLLKKDVVDHLGKRFLGHLRDHHPAIPRIAVTGAPPGAVVGLIKEYGLAELLLKQTMRLVDVGDVVEKEILASGLSKELRAERGELWDDFEVLRKDIQHRINRQAKNLEAGRGTSQLAGPDRQAASALEAFGTSRTAFEADSSAVAAMLVNVRDQADLDAANGAFTALQDKYEDAF